MKFYNKCDSNIVVPYPICNDSDIVFSFTLDTFYYKITPKIERDTIIINKNVTVISNPEYVCFPKHKRTQYLPIPHDYNKNLPTVVVIYYKNREYYFYKRGKKYFCKVSSKNITGIKKKQDHRH